MLLRRTFEHQEFRCLHATFDAADFHADRRTRLPFSIHDNYLQRSRSGVLPFQGFVQSLFYLAINKVNQCLRCSAQGSAGLLGFGVFLVFIRITSNSVVLTQGIYGGMGF